MNLRIYNCMVEGKSFVDVDCANSQSDFKTCTNYCTAKKINMTPSDCWGCTIYKQHGYDSSTIVETATLAPVESTAIPSLLQRARKLGRAVVSKAFEKRVSKAQAKARIAVCTSCEAYDPKGWCNACGCSKNKFTLLTVKAKIRYSTCPKGKWDQAVNPPPAT